ncbi:hypothetical protein [Sinomicrobium oceani]|uniref:hypothetical protein n=1 Tax=Sinomicrobium oceani TaxID=1150368 RepID=UPI00227C62E5|nr:hypothetical protein [Sinomicrobium oceani]
MVFMVIQQAALRALCRGVPISVELVVRGAKKKRKRRPCSFPYYAKRGKAYALLQVLCEFSKRIKV